ncbi:HTH-type transcriptional regulator GltC [Paraburkholderia sediminicola]|uniref:HTH-type transcriptional regulator GltC n=1 Tax=Paraburkholderia sediminicola TaxID=458836 RepID=A0A6J5CVL6_9BURK|nr:LysR family transcriptional regulator [Paraburkholderia sediminicola]CAB3745546.1 HTH-type transcriptional regulator GltC [Paraburkholderia sediminicola]
MSKSAAPNLRSQFTAQTLQILLAVEEHGSLAKAAERVHLVPSAVSRRIAELEENCGLQLLRRTSHGTEFTAAGKTVLTRARTILSEMDTLADELHTFSEGIRGAVRLAASVFALTQRLPADLAQFRSEYPLITLEFNSRTSHDVIHALQKEEIDVGVFVSDSVPSGLTTMIYEEDKLALLVPEDHPLAVQTSAGIDEIAQYELVVGPLGTETRALTADQARRRGLKLRASIQVASLDAMILMTRAGHGIAIVPSRAWEALGPFRGLKKIEIGEQWASRQMLVGVPAGTPLSTPAGRLFTKLSRKGNV